MQRRKVDVSKISVGDNVALGTGIKPPRSLNNAPSTLSRRNRKGSQQSLCLLVGMIALLFVTLSFVAPKRFSELESDVQEQFLNNFGEQKPPQLHVEEQSETDPASSLHATRIMEKQTSQWVEGEKKLKEALKKLMERQKEGKDLGVPILTRWLGDDFPAWPQEGESPEEWEEKRKAKYEEMKKEEEAWRKKVRTEIFEDEDR
mmetsp:Transcript_13693/g.20854  ORF Transcript_13693/g.20854 Transcript_13693/m.20854 type:complete len:203 (+) Transcript_13693:148-756(+)|eukprot:CAMPEP_0178920128 /NCGR_PEP_ID=MMETSP0786-20121207/14831_1 /TAXON_ID=186022 /ORGANISM="Thalassionema frauenfeldii, Strain CCMP 1798" /LENGTH=202 /DNA_ID=CAMNT_0020594157 /DNA_START=107 /DNA_END=715 /DNA_ORIENTATION=+